MLSRVADSLYWMSRYLERAEHTARLIGLNLNLMLDQSPDTASQRWRRLQHCLGLPDLDDPADAVSMTRALTFDPANSASIVGCIAAARENARQVREQISTEMWEQLNRLYLQVKRADSDAIWQAEPHEFYQMVKDGAHLFQGITDATLSHGEGWQFIQLGRFIERAGATALLLDVYFRELLPSQPLSAEVADYLEWVGLLKSCTAFEAYCKVYTASLRPDRIAEFLLLDRNCPRSLRFAADCVQSALKALPRTSSSTYRGPDIGLAERLAGRWQAALDYGHVDEIMAENIHAYLANIRRQCTQIHAAIQQTYISYPIETALAS